MRNFPKMLFQRVVVVSLSILLQIGVVLLGVVWFRDYARWFNIALNILAALMTLYILTGRANSAYKMAWIVPILIAPVFGVTLYLLFGGNRLSKRQKRKMHVMDRTFREQLRQDETIIDRIEVSDSMAAAQAHYLLNNAGCPVYENTESEYYPVGEYCYREMLKDLRAAEHYIYLEYFIISEGKMWDSILEILEKKAKQGLDVRVIYDDFGCINYLPVYYYKKLEKRGIRACVFNPYVPVLSGRLNNRDHRKFLIIDGRVGYTGGINLSDEYINETVRFGHWKDCGIRLEGDAVWAMTNMFLSMWCYIKNEPYPVELYQPGKKVLLEDHGYVQPFSDSPLDNEIVSETIFLNLISRAKKSVYIMTPYLIIDEIMISALCVAAKSGIDVRIITPGIPDKKYVFAVTRANYEELLDAGVQIYEYSPGFLHSKVICVDVEYAVAGTINMDFRSLYLHFEDGVLLYRTESVQQIAGDFADTFPLCQKITARSCRPTKWYARLMQTCLRVFSPLM